jgi:hypothetical protein
MSSVVHSAASSKCAARDSRDDDRVEDFRVGRARRLGCDHNDDLKSSATAQDENQDDRAYHGDNQGTYAPEAVGEECEHYLKSALLPQAVFIMVGESGRLLIID